MDVEQVIDRVIELLEKPTADSSVTSVRIHSNIKRAQDIAYLTDDHVAVIRI